jgi:hypothetical protein
MNSKEIKKMCCILLTYIIVCYNNFAQPGICPPLTYNWNTASANFDHDQWGSVNNLGSVDYKWQTVGADIEVYVDWDTFINSSDFYNFTDKDLKDYLVLQIIFDRLPCPYVGSRVITITEKVPCTIEKKCYIKINSSQEFDCIPEYWPGNPPQFMVIGQDKYIVESILSDCGYSCCRTIYTVICSEGSGTSGSNKPVIYNMFKEAKPGSTCSEQYIFYDCKTDEPVECKSNCE